MADNRKHRGAHPQDALLFAPQHHVALRDATDDLVWLLTSGGFRASGVREPAWSLNTETSSALDSSPGKLRLNADRLLMNPPKFYPFLVVLYFLATLFHPAWPLHAGESKESAVTKTNPIYAYPLVDIDGKKASLKEHRNKVLLIVNVASDCGATPQYATLVALQKKFEPKGLVVIGIPGG